MQEQRIEDQDREDRVSPNDRDKAVLKVMLSDPAPWSFEELVREFDGNRVGLEVSLNELVANGLINRLGDFYFPSRAARRIEEIAVD